MLKMNRSMQSIGMNLSAALTLPIGAFAATATKTAAEFGFIQAKIAGLSGSSTIIEGLSNSARQLGRETIFTAAEVSNLQLELVKLGLREKEIKAVQDQTVRFAQALDVDLAQAGSTIVQLLNKMPGSFDQFASKTEAVTYATDAFAYAVAGSALDVDGLTSSLNYVGAEADAMGFSFENTVGMLAVLANAGYKGSRAGTQLRRILVEVAAASEDSGKAMREFNNSGATFQEVMQQVGIRAAGMGAALQGQQGFIDRFAKGMENSEGYLQNVSDVIEDSLQYSLKRTQSAFEELQISFVTAVEPAIRSLLDALTFLMNGFSAVPGPIKVVMAILASLAAVIGPLLVIIARYNVLMIQATVANARFAASMRLIMSSLGWVGVVGLAIGILASFITSTDSATQSFEEFKDSLKDLTVPEDSISALQEKILELDKQLRENERNRNGVFFETNFLGFRLGVMQRRARIAELTREEVLLTEQRKELERMLAIQKEFKKGADIADSVRASLGADRALADSLGGGTFDQLLARYRKLESDIASFQKRARQPGVNIVGILGDISVMQEERDEVKKTLETLGYSFENSKKKGIDPWAQAIENASKAWKAADFDYGINNDQLARVEALAQSQRQLALAAQELGKGETAIGLKAVQDYIKFLSDAEALRSTENLLNTIEEVDARANTAVSQAQFKVSLGIIDQEQYIQELISAYEDYAQAQLDLGLEDRAREFFLLAQSLKATAGATAELAESNASTQELLGFVQNIGNAFGNIFRDLTSGSKTFAEALKTNMIDALTAILAKLVAIAVMWGIIAILSGGTSVLSGAASSIQKAGFGSFAMGQFGLGSFANKSVAVTVDGSISGHTIYLSNKRALNSYDRTYGG